MSLKSKVDIQNKKAEENSKCKNPYYEGAKKICHIRNFTTSLPQEVADINVVCISLSGLNFDEVNPLANSYGSNSPLDTKIVTYSRKHASAHFRQYKEALLFATDELKADIVCINELGMPMTATGKMSDKIIDFTKKVANDSTCLIASGSYHDKDTLTNQGYVFFPGKGYIPELSEEVDYIHYFKNVSAFGIQEKINTPPSRILYYTKAFGIGISFMICLEVVDYSSSAQIGSKHEVVDLLLVPAYVLEEYGPMHKVSKKLSSALGAVILNNYYSGGGEAPNRIFNYGEIVGDSNLKTQILPNGARLTQWNLNRTKLREGKRHSHSNLSKEHSCLFGMTLATA